MQQHDIAGFQPVQILHHPGEIHRAGILVEIAVRHRFDPEIFEDAQVVGPGWQAVENTRLRVGHLDQLERLPAGAGATRGGSGGDLVTGHSPGENQVNHRIMIGRIAQQADIGLGLLRLQQLPLGLFHRAHHRCHALGILVDADAKVDLAVPLVLAEHVHQLHDLVDGLLRQLVEHQFSPVSTGRVGNAPHSVQDPS